MQNNQFLDYYQWPINIKQLYYYKDEKVKINKDKKGNLSGVFSSDHISGWMYEVMCDFEEKFCFLPPITIVQKNFNPESGFGKLDLNHIYEKTSPVCSKLREGIGKGKICDTIDFAVSVLLIGQSEKEVHKWNQDKIDELSKEVDNVTQNIEKCKNSSCNLELGKPFGAGSNNSDCSYHWHIVYQCPCTHMTEIAFPVFIKGTVVAVLITGQFIQKQNLDSTLKRFKSIGCPVDEKQEKMLRERFSQTDFNKVLCFFQKKLCEFEQHLADRVERNTKSFMFNVSMEFADGLTTLTSEKNSEMLNADKFDILTSRLSLKALKPFITEQNKRLQKDWQMRSLFPDEHKAYIRFPANNLRADNLNVEESLISDNDVCFISKESEYFPYALQVIADENSILLTYEHNKLIHLAVLLTSKNVLSDEEKEQLITLFGSIFPSWYSKLLYGQISREKDEYNLSLKIIGHDLGQFAFSVNSCLDQIKLIWQKLYTKCSVENPNALASEFVGMNSRFEMYAKDADAFMNNINLISETARMRSFNRNLTKTEFLIFGQISYRLADSFRVALRDNCMKLIIPKTVKANDQLRPKMYGESSHIELAIYNLLGNAFKYGFEGSCIYFDCLKKDTQYKYKTPHTITVRNYGPNIPEEERENIFSMGYRVLKHKPGEGFGLFLVKEVTDEHYGRCWCECGSNAISEYNISFIKGGIEYLQRGKNNLNDEEAELLKSLLAEDVLLTNKGIYDMVVQEHIKFNMNKRAPQEFLNELRKPTYEVIFYLEIPPKYIQEEKEGIANK